MLTHTILQLSVCYHHVHNVIQNTSYYTEQPMKILAANCKSISTAHKLQLMLHHTSH